MCTRFFYMFLSQKSSLSRYSLVLHILVFPLTLREIIQHSMPWFVHLTPPLVPFPLVSPSNGLWREAIHQHSYQECCGCTMAMVHVSLIIGRIMGCAMSLSLYPYVSFVPLLCLVISYTGVICALLLCCVLLYSYFYNCVLRNLSMRSSTISYYYCPHRNKVEFSPYHSLVGTLHISFEAILQMLNVS